MLDEVTRRSGGVIDGVVAAAGVSTSDNALNVSVNFFGAVASLLFVDGGGEAAARGDDWPTGRHRNAAPT